jgi:hypothetical protein
MIFVSKRSSCVTLRLFLCSPKVQDKAWHTFCESYKAAVSAQFSREKRKEENLLAGQFTQAVDIHFP